MTSWRELQLGSVVELKRGYDLPASQREPGAVPVVSSAGRSGLHSTAKVAGPGVVTGRYGTLGEVYFIREAFWPLNTALYVRDFKGNNPRYVAALLKSLQLEQNDSAAAVPGLNRNHLHQLAVCVPSRSVQDRIGAVLLALDDLIAVTRRRIQSLEEIARTVCREWLEDFRYPGHEGHELVDSPLGRVPAEWNVIPVEDIAAIVRGRSYRKSELVDKGGVPFINLKCLERGGGFRRDGLKRYAGKFHPDQVARPGDIVIGVTDLTQGREILARATFVPSLRGESGVISLDVARVVPKTSEDRLAVFAALRYSDLADRVKELANGSTVLHLSPDHIAKALIVWPVERIRRAVGDVLGPAFDLCDRLGAVSDRLVSLRDLLLPGLVSGEIDLSSLDLDALVEEAAM